MPGGMNKFRKYHGKARNASKTEVILITILKLAILALLIAYAIVYAI